MPLALTAGICGGELARSVAQAGKRIIPFLCHNQ